MTSATTAAVAFTAAQGPRLQLPRPQDRGSSAAGQEGEVAIVWEPPRR